MFNQDVSQFAVLMTGIGEVYGKSFTTAVIEVYWNILKAFEFEDVKKAIYFHLKNPDEGKYLPKPADIIRAIEGGSQNQALQAWTKVLFVIQRVGVYASVAFDDDLIHAVIEDMGGRRRFGTIDDKQLSFVGKEFQERYRGYVKRKPTRHPKYFAGIIESNNGGACGYAHDPPVLIGDKTKAKQVIAMGSSASILEGNLGCRTLLLENNQDRCQKNRCQKLSILKTE